MRSQAAIALVICVTLLVTATSLTAHHSFESGFDANKVVSSKGVVTRIEWVNPHSYILVDATAADGTAERWAIEGPAPNQLARRNIDKAFLKVGDVIEFCGYGTKDGVQPIRTTVGQDPRASSSGRLIIAELLTMADGRNIVWSPYGHTKCREMRHL